MAGIDPRALELQDGTPAMIDGSRGILQIEPSDDERASVVARQGRLEHSAPPSAPPPRSPLRRPTDIA